MIVRSRKNSLICVKLNKKCKICIFLFFRPPTRTWNEMPNLRINHQLKTRGFNHPIAHEDLQLVLKIISFLRLTFVLKRWTVIHG